MARLISRGQVWVTDLNPGFGVEIHKKRPVLVISNDLINNHALRIIVLPFSSQINPLNPGKVFIPKNICGVDKESIVLAADIRSIDKSRLIKKIGDLPKIKLLEVEDSLKLVLGLKELD